MIAIHEALLQAKSSILAANAEDLRSASKAAADGQLSQSVLKRLDLGRPGKYDDMLKGILDVRELEDPSTFLEKLRAVNAKLIRRTVGLVGIMCHSGLLSV